MSLDKPDRMSRFREEALARGVPAHEVEQWADMARRCARLGSRVQGPEVGRFGGPVLLRPGDPDPVFPLIATVDCAALPPGITDIPLPAAGHLLFFAEPTGLYEHPVPSLGEVRYVPEGAAVEERAPAPFDNPDDLELTQAPMYGEHDITLPDYGETLAPPEPEIPSYVPHAAELLDTWRDVASEFMIPGDALQIGGWGSDEFQDYDPATKAGQYARVSQKEGYTSPEAPVPNPDDWTLLAQWNPDVTDMESAVYHWSIAKKDLTAHHFTRAHVTMTANP